MITEYNPPSLVAEGTRLEGEFTFCSFTYFGGALEGTLNHVTEEELRIGPTALIHGAIRSAGKVIIEGRVSGDVTSQIHIELTSRAQVTGSLKAPTLSILAGAIVEADIHSERAAFKQTRLKAAA